MIVEATNCNRTFAAENKSLAADFDSHVIDFKDMPMGSIDIYWSALTGTLTGVFKIYASNMPTIASFDLAKEIDGSAIVPHATNGSRIWIRDRLAFRYALVRFTKNGTAGGLCNIIALGKKS